jgi:hypothetical protein
MMGRTIDYIGLLHPPMKPEERKRIENIYRSVRAAAKGKQVKDGKGQR